MFKSIGAFHIMNTILILSGISVILDYLHIYSMIGSLPLFYYIIPVGGVLLLKNFLKPDDERLRDPLTNAAWPRRFIFSAMGILMIAVMFKIMHWPFATYLFLVSISFQFAALITSYFVKAPVLDDDDIIDANVG